jgi:hypothetical protein
VDAMSAAATRDIFLKLRIANFLSDYRHDWRLINFSNQEYEVKWLKRS